MSQSDHQFYYNFYAKIFFKLLMIRLVFLAVRRDAWSGHFLFKTSRKDMSEGKRERDRFGDWDRKGKGETGKSIKNDVVTIQRHYEVLFYNICTHQRFQLCISSIEWIIAHYCGKMCLVIRYFAARGLTAYRLLIKIKMRCYDK